MPFTSLCCLIAEAKAARTMLNSSGENKASLSLFLTMEEKLSGRWYKLWVFPIWLLWCRRMFHLSIYSYFVEGFYKEWMLSFAKCFFCIWEDHMGLILSFIKVVYHIDWFVNIEPSWQPGIIPSWSWWIILLMYCWIWFASILMRIFASMVMKVIGL